MWQHPVRGDRPIRIGPERKPPNGDYVINRSLTHEEIPLLPEEFNLTDGHVYRRWSPDESQIIARASGLFASVNRQMQPELEAAYVKTLLGLHLQSYAPAVQRQLICLTASESLEIIANHLRLTGRSLALVEPCFDNLPNIFRRHGIPLVALPDALLDSPALAEWLVDVDVDAICIVSPNNPTGALLSEASLGAVVRYCQQRDAILIIDSSFRAYTPREVIYDQYAMLADAGIDYVIVEDTGKTWPTMELKASVMTMPRTMFSSIYSIYTDFLLHISPFVLQLLTEFVALSAADSCAYVQEVVAGNRQILYEAIADTQVRPAEARHSSVAWLAVPSAGEFVRVLGQKGVFALAGERFFWSEPEQGAQRVRLALTRDQTVFQTVAERIAAVARQVSERE